MRVTAAILCDAASVREGLLHVLGGGITRLWREQLPAEIGVTLALMFEAERHEQILHEVGVTISEPGGAEIAQARGGIHPEFGRLEPGETQIFSMPLPLQRVGVGSYGRHDLTIQVNGVEQDTKLAFWVLHPDERHLPALD